MRRPTPAPSCKAAPVTGRRRCFMEYKGIQYRVRQMANPPGWEWVVHLDADKTKTGLSYSRESAIFNAKCAIERALDVPGREPDGPENGYSVAHIPRTPIPPLPFLILALQNTTKIPP